jgi:signal transduction histidine kinase
LSVQTKVLVPVTALLVLLPAVVIWIVHDSIPRAVRDEALAFSFAGVLVGAGFVWFFVRRILRPLRQLREAAEAVGRGDFSRRIDGRADDELGDLAEALNHLTSSLQTSRAELAGAAESLQATQAQLIQSEKLSAVGQFVAGVAHELNNPLTAVIGFADLLVQTTADPTLRPHLERIARSAHRCHQIVQNLLGFARQHPPERVRLELNDVIDEVLQSVADDFRAGNVEIVREFAEGLPPILADRRQLQQVFIAVLGNGRQAIQAFSGKGRITLRTRGSGADVQVELADNGPGISAENLPRVFDPFFTTKPVGQGTGLGLSLCHGIVREHGGTISARSQPGQGASILITLPAFAPGEATA